MVEQKTSGAQRLEEGYTSYVKYCLKYRGGEKAWGVEDFFFPSFRNVGCYLS